MPRRNVKRRNRSKLTPGGEAFLRCALAPFDFTGGAPSGFPDLYTGNTVVKMHRQLSPLTASNTSDFFLIVSPVLGWSHFYTTVTPGTMPTSSTVWTGIPYPDTPAFFQQGGNPTTNVTRFRYLSNVVELACVSNAISWSGTITGWKANVALALDNTTAGTARWTIRGLESTGRIAPNNYIGPCDKGIYMINFMDDANCEFQEVIELESSLPLTIGAVDFGQFSTGSSAQDMYGFGTLESSIIRISGVVASAQPSFTLKIAACVEYQVNTFGVLGDYTRPSAPYDPVALALYKQLYAQLPVAVDYFHNESFWKRVLEAIGMVGGALAVLPGPYGMVAGGLGLAATGASSFF